MVLLLQIIEVTIHLFEILGGGVTKPNMTPPIVVKGPKAHDSHPPFNIVELAAVSSATSPAAAKC